MNPHSAPCTCAMFAAYHVHAKECAVSQAVAHLQAQHNSLEAQHHLFLQLQQQQQQPPPPPQQPPLQPQQLQQLPQPQQQPQPQSSPPPPLQLQTPQSPQQHQQQSQQLSQQQQTLAQQHEQLQQQIMSADPANAAALYATLQAQQEQLNQLLMLHQARKRALQHQQQQMQQLAAAQDQGNAYQPDSSAASAESIATQLAVQALQGLSLNGPTHLNAGAPVYGAPLAPFTPNSAGGAPAPGQERVQRQAVDATSPRAAAGSAGLGVSDVPPGAAQGGSVGEPVPRRGVDGIVLTPTTDVAMLPAAAHAVGGEVPSQLMSSLSEAASRWQILLDEPPLGAGHFAQVRRCRHMATGELFAIKIIDKKDLTQSWPVVQGEIDILRRVGQHRNIVGLVDSFMDSTHFYLVMEFCRGGDLFSRIVKIGKFTERDAARACRELALALQHIHSCGVTHRDLKPENILLTDDAPDSPIKVADFGLSKLMPHDLLMKTVCGTWAYCAPEVIEARPYTSAVDNWTLGVLMYILVSGYHPFDPYGNAAEPVLLRSIVNCNYDFGDAVWRDISPDARELITGLLRIAPEERMSLETVLASSWIQGNASERENPHLLPRLSSLQYIKHRNPGQ